MKARAFLSPVPDVDAVAGAEAPAAVSPLEPALAAAGARFENLHGWRVATGFGSPAEELEACRSGIGVADRSGIGKFELQGDLRELAGVLEGIDEVGLWRASPDRALALCEPAETAGLRARLQDACARAPRCGVVEQTAGFAAIALYGPGARALLERLTAIDVREPSLPLGGVRAGTVAGVAATLLRTGAEAYLALLSSSAAPDAWEIFLDAGEPLGARPVGEDSRPAAAIEAEHAPGAAAHA
jgi:heterotetrameric sarcosine oxidase gamma subunit